MLDQRRSRGLSPLREVKETVLHRKHLDSSIDFIGKLVFGFEGPSVLEATKGPGQPLVDYWDCLKMMVRDFESRCGSLTQYGTKHMRAFTNICNNGVSETEKEASISACGQLQHGEVEPAGSRAQRLIGCTAVVCMGAVPNAPEVRS